MSGFPEKHAPCHVPAAPTLPPALRASALTAPTHIHSREHVSLTHSITTSSASSAARPWLSWLNTSSLSCFNLRVQEMKHKGDV